MAKPVAAVDYGICRPEACEKGICPCVKGCEHKVMKQEAPFEPPYVMTLCVGCGDCVKICPLCAVRLM